MQAQPRGCVRVRGQGGLVTKGADMPTSKHFHTPCDRLLHLDRVCWWWVAAVHGKQRRKIPSQHVPQFCFDSWLCRLFHFRSLLLVIIHSHIFSVSPNSFSVDNPPSTSAPQGRFTDLQCAVSVPLHFLFTISLCRQSMHVVQNTCAPFLSQPLSPHTATMTVISPQPAPAPL